MRYREPKLCRCGSGEYDYELVDAAGIFCSYVCEKCEAKTRRKYDPAIFDGNTVNRTGLVRLLEGSSMRSVESLTRLEKKYLSRRVCAWCEHRLDWPGCGAIWEKCSKETQDRRRDNCLKDYKPRRSHDDDLARP